MNLQEALTHVLNGRRVTCDKLSQGSVLKRERDRLRVVFEATGDSYDFVPHAMFYDADWRIVKGWV